MEDVVSQQAAEACHYLRSQIPIELQRPAVGIICGSGLHGLADVVISQPRHVLHYRDIPHFPLSTGNLDSSSAGNLKDDNMQQCRVMRDSFYLGFSKPIKDR